MRLRQQRNHPFKLKLLYDDNIFTIHTIPMMLYVRMTVALCIQKFQLKPTYSS